MTGCLKQVGMVGTCCGCHQHDEAWVDSRVLFSKMTGYFDSDEGFKSALADINSKLVLALWVLIPVVVQSLQCMGFLLLPCGFRMIASMPNNGSFLRVFRILLPTIFLSKA